jgi:ketol-acid reductoisomerase
MTDNVENLILEPLRLIREDIGAIRRDMGQLRTDFRDEIADVGTDLMGQRAILVGFGKYLGAIDQRVEHIEEKLGIEG